MKDKGAIYDDALAELEQELAEMGQGLRFRPALEAAFQRFSVEARNKHIEQYLLVYACANVLCLPCDYQAGGKAFHLGLLFRIGCIVPLALATVVVLRSHVIDSAKALCATLPIVFGTAFATVLARLTIQPFTDRYLFGAAVGIMAQTLIAPIPFPFAAAALACSTASLAALSLLPLRGYFLPPATPDLVLFVVGVGACFLYQRYKLEQNMRRDYLLRETNRLQTDRVMKANAHLERLSSVDPLTGVFNRRYLDAALDRLWNVAMEKERWIALLMVDIDSFKRINDTLGHQHGDFCLEHVAQGLQGSVRAGVDTIARYGGEEFMALLPDADDSLAENTACRVRQQIEGLGLASYSGNALTVSIGIAAIKGSRHQLTLPEFIAAADAALYEAKKAGRNTVVSGSHLLHVRKTCHTGEV